MTITDVLSGGYYLVLKCYIMVVANMLKRLTKSQCEAKWSVQVCRMQLINFLCLFK